MSRSDEQRIADILDACHEIATVVQIRAASAVPEPVLLRAAERLLEIIGEAASMVTDEVRRIPGGGLAQHHEVADRTGPSLPPHGSGPDLVVRGR